MEIKQIAEIAMDLLDEQQSFVQITTVMLHDEDVDIAFLKGDGTLIATNEVPFTDEIVDKAKMLFAAAEKKNGIVTFYEDIPEEEKMAEDADADIRSQFMLEFIDGKNPEHEIFYRELYMALEERLPIKLVLIESKGTAVGRRYQALFKPNGELAGDAGIEKAVREEISKEKGKNNRQVDIDGLTFFLMPIGSQHTVYLMGDSENVKNLCPHIKKAGYRTVVIGLDTEKTNEEKLPDADGILVPKSYLDIFYHVPADEYSMVLVMTESEETDAFVLGQALETRAGYIAVTGNNISKNKLSRRLSSEGWREDSIRRIEFMDYDVKNVLKKLEKYKA